MVYDICPGWGATVPVAAAEGQDALVSHLTDGAAPAAITPAPLADSVLGWSALIQLHKMQNLCLLQGPPWGAS